MKRLPGKVPLAVIPLFGLLEVEVSTDETDARLDRANAVTNRLSHLDKAKTKPGHDALFWHFPHYVGSGSGPGSSVRVGERKIIEWLEDNSAKLLYLATDLSEKNNVAAQLPETVQRHRERLLPARK